MLDLFLDVSSHSYSCVLIHKGVVLCEKNYNSRQEANSKMYSLMGKYGLQLRKVYNDKHDKTYKCTDNAEFHINRY